MRLLLIGAPGAGKGTQAELLAKRFGIAHISSGDLLRQHVRDQTSLGQTAKSYVDKGDLVPDYVVMDMLRKPVAAAAKAGGYVLDGFPRTVEQAKASFPTARALGAEVQAAIHLDVAREELVRRLLARRRGSDDTEAVIENRLQVYLDKTVPLLEYYAGREWMFTVDGSQPPDAVHADILARLQKLADFVPPSELGVVWKSRGSMFSTSCAGWDSRRRLMSSRGFCPIRLISIRSSRSSRRTASRGTCSPARWAAARDAGRAPGGGDTGRARPMVGMIVMRPGAT